MRREPRHALPADEPLAEPLAHDAFKREVGIWAERLDAKPKEVHITAMTRKWASCSARGRVTFADDLLAQPENVRREVIVHELLHLKIPNHGPLFRALLTTHLANDAGFASTVAVEFGDEARRARRRD